MNALLIYLLKVIAIQAVLYLIYALVFHKSGRHAFNRYYVILVLVLSFVIPTISISIPDSQGSEETVETATPIWYEIVQLTTAEPELIPIKKSAQSDYTTEIVFVGVSLISLFLLMKLVFSHFQLLRLKKQSKKLIKNGHKIYCSRIDIPFSYFRSIFIPKSILNLSSFDTILEHELVHVNKKHSLDRLFLELCTAIVWFNPFHYLFRNRLIETHEFQADEEVLNIQKDPIAYQEVLYQQISAPIALTTANHFNLNTIKTRIKMMNKNQKRPKWHYLLILPAIALMTFSFANKEDISPVPPLTADVSEVLSNVVNTTDNFTPSILPLQDVIGVKLTVGYGKRIHPILKVESMHEGVDFKTYLSNRVLATADGTVVEADVIFEGAYGKKIVIDHNGIYQTAYAHLSQVKVEKGDKVKRGDVIGNAGLTGETSAPHLHYEVKSVDKGFLDPVDFINDYNFEAPVLKGEANGTKLGKPNQKLKVVIDPAHGGKDKGMASSQLSEKEITLKVAKVVAENFKNSDEIEIILTREADDMVSLEDRVSKSENADLFISLHVESHEYEEEDMMYAIYNDNNKNSEASKHFSELLSQEFSNIDKKFRVGYTRGYYVLKNTKCPAVLFSMGYFSNQESEEYLNSENGRKQIAQELSDALKASL